MSAPQGETPAAGGGNEGPPPEQQGPSPEEIAAGLQNKNLGTLLLLSLVCVSAALVLWRLSLGFQRYIRRVGSLNNSTQKYFATTTLAAASLKRNLLYAPIVGRRVNREFKIGKSINAGTLPTRFQFMFLAAYFSTNIAFCVLDIPFATGTAPDIGSLLLSRTGNLAVINMIPLFLLAGRNNPLIALLNISFDSFNLVHRWIGRIVVLEVSVHAFCVLQGLAAQMGWSAALSTVTSTPLLLYGFIAVIAITVISIQAMSPVRHAFYETFKVLHIALAAVVVYMVYNHLSALQSPALGLFFSVIPTWAIDRVIRMARIAYYNIGAGGTRTVVQALPGDACRVSVTTARPWAFAPGQHAYLYMPGVSWWQSHPFSAAWSDETDAMSMSDEKLPSYSGDVLGGKKKTTISFVIRARSGFTSRLHKKALASPDGRLVTSCWAEGAYGGHHDLNSYGTAVLFAGGIGITHAVPQVRDLIAGYTNGTVATQRIVLVWIIQSPEHLEWIRPWMTEILAMEKRREVLRILLYVSRPKSTKEIHSPSETVQMFPGRPNVDSLLGNEVTQQVGAMGVSVCGPGALGDEVRAAVRKRQHQGTIDLLEESFSW